MSTYRTLNERKYTDPSLHTLRWNRSMREAGIRNAQLYGESDETGGFIAVVLLAAVVALLVGAVWLTR